MDQSPRRCHLEDEEQEENDEDEDSHSDYSQDTQRSGDGGGSTTSSSSSASSSGSCGDLGEHKPHHLCPAEQLLLDKKNNSNTNNSSNNKQTHNHHNQTINSSYQPVHKTSATGRMGSLFMQERLIEEEENQEDDDDDRPIRGNMKIREDTMDGAENPDTDPPQRRKTLEDISITELSSLGASLPPGECLNGRQLIMIIYKTL